MADTNDSQSAFMTTSLIKDWTEALGQGTVYSADVPDNHGVGDLLIALITKNDNDALSPDQSGWTLITEDSNTNNRTNTYWRIATDSEPSEYSWTGDSENWYVRMLCIASYHFDASDPINIANDATGSSNNPTTPDVTTDVDGCWLLALWGQYRTTNRNSTITQTGWGKEWEEYGPHSYWGPLQGAWSKFQTSLGATGTVDWTTSNGQNWVAVIIALNPAPGTHTLSQKHAYIAVNERSSTSAFIMSREAVVTLQPSDAEDNYSVEGWYNDTNYSTRTYLISEDTFVSQMATMNIDVSEIPSTALITKVTLRLYKLNTGDDMDIATDFGVYAILQEYIESQSTFTQSATGYKYAKWGAKGVGDVDLAPMGITTLALAQGIGYVDFDIDITRFRWWIDGTRTNNGLQVVPTSFHTDTERPVAALCSFASSNNATVAFRPQFIIEFNADLGNPLQTSSKSAYMNGQVSSSVSAHIVVGGQDSTSAYLYSNRRTETIIASKDTSLCDYSTDARNPYGRRQFMYLDDYTISYWILVQFDLSGIPSNAIVESATLRLYNYSSTSPSSDKISAARVLARDWDEESATWVSYQQDDNWASSGADGVGDRYEQIIGTHTFQNGDPVGWVEWDLASSPIREWIDGTKPNYGLHLDRDSTGVVFRPYFYSRNYEADTTLRPQLVIDYWLPADTAVSSQSAMLMNQGKAGSTSAFLAGQGELRLELEWDTYLRAGGFADSNYGSSNALTAYYGVGSTNYVPLIKFPDLESLGLDDAVFSTLQLSWWMYDENSSTQTIFNFYPILVEWAELQATYNNRLTTGGDVPWDTPGCKGVDTDYLDQSMGSVTYSPTETENEFKDIDLDEALFRQWMSGVLENWGLVVHGDVSGYYYHRSSNYTTDETQRPKLTILYEFGVPASDSQSAYMEGGLPTATDSLDAYLQGGVVATPSSQDAFVQGGLVTTSGLDAFVQGQEAVSDAALSFTQGSLDTTDSQTAYLIGSLGAIDSQDAFVQGSTDTAASQTAWLQGSIDTTSNLDAFIQGQASTIASTPMSKSLLK